MSCMYCDDDRDLFAGAEGMGCAIESIRIERVCYLPADEGEPPESQARIFISVGGGEACTRPIRYCPMCGKEF